MTRQTWTAFLAAILFVTLAAGIALIPVPYVVWAPGNTIDTLGEVEDQPVVQISGAPTHATTGELDLTTVSVTKPDSSLSLPEAVAAYWLPRRDALPREWVYPEGVPATQVRQTEQDQMTAAENAAVVAALKAADIEVFKMPSVATLTAGSPADGLLEPGDLIAAVGNTPVSTVEDLQRVINHQRPGDTIKLRVYRNRAELPVNVTLGSKPDRPTDAYAGITIGIGYRYGPIVSVDVGERLGGPSAGLVLALAIYDKLSPGSLIGDLHVAGTGTIDAEGRVGPIGGVQQKLAAAEAARATVFVLPAANCVDLRGVRTNVFLVPVSTLGDALASLHVLSQPGGQRSVGTC